VKEYKVEMPYIGRILSKNSYKFKNRGTRPEVKKWMKELEEKVGVLGIQIPKGDEVEIGVYGYFWDNGRPDLHNLFDCTADALKKGLGVDDRYFRMVADGWECGERNQRLVIRIKV